MINRRGFLKAGLVSALPFAAGASPLFAPRDGVAAIPLYTVIFDERFADGLAFASEARWMGQRVDAIDGDITRLWYDDLYHRWKQGPAAIAGLTTPQAFFCLEELGRDAGLRKRFAVRHSLRQDRVIHYLHGSETALRHSEIASAGRGWSANMARLIVACPAEPGTVVSSQDCSMLSSAAEQEPAMLVSWLLAPRAMA